MPASAQSVEVTARYQQALGQLQAQAATRARAHWGAIDPSDLAGSFPEYAQQVAPGIVATQRAGATLSAAYIGAYLTSERGEPAPAPTIEAERYAGQTPAGADVADALASTAFGVLKHIKDRDTSLPLERTVELALGWGLARCMRLGAESAGAATRGALADLLASAHDTFEGWTRVTRPRACVACLASADGKVMPLSSPLRIHAHCSCVAQPVVCGVPQRVRQRTGHEQFEALSPGEQEQLAGADAVKALRDGTVKFANLAVVNRMTAQPDQIQQRPDDELAHVH